MGKAPEIGRVPQRSDPDSIRRDVWRKVSSNGRTPHVKSVGTRRKTHTKVAHTCVEDGRRRGTPRRTREGGWKRRT